MNQFTGIGRLGGDPELKFLEDGKAVCSFSIAIDQPGQEAPQWIRCSCWEKKAEFAANWLKKGNRALVQGPIRLRKWSSDDGQVRVDLELTVRELHPIDWPERNGQPSIDTADEAPHPAEGL